MLGYPEHAARRWEPIRLRLRLFSAPGSLARHPRRNWLHPPARNPWTVLILAGLRRLREPPRRVRRGGSATLVP